MRLDCGLVERVDDFALGESTGRADLFGDIVDGGEVSPREEELRTFTRKRASNGTADGASRCVNDGDLVLEQHCSLLAPFALDVRLRHSAQ